MNATLDWKDLHISSDKDAVLSASEKSEKETNIRISWANQPEAPSHLEIHWSLPLLDIQYEWYPQCRMRRALHVDWEPPVKTRVSIGAPVFCFYNGAARNRFTMALSDVVSIIDCTLGVREEDGHLYCNIRVPLDRNDRTREYSLTLYRDTSDISFAEALRRVSAWWETDCGLTPMNVPEAARLPLYSAWYSFHQNTIASELEAECALAVKAGIFLSSLIVAAMLNLIGYEAGMTMNATQVNIVAWSTGGYVALGYGLGLVLLIFYKISDADAVRYIKENQERAQAAKAENK